MLGPLSKLLALLLVFVAAPAAFAAAEPLRENWLELRLQQEVNSYSSKAGDRVQAVLIAPFRVDGLERISPGARVWGDVAEVRRVGVGFVRETAALTIRFTEIEIDQNVRLRINAQVLTIDNARERVDGTGRIRGIRSTNTPGFRASGLLTSLAAVDPIALAFSTAAFATLLRFSEPEIRLQAGTELVVELLEPVDLPPLPPPLLGLPEPLPADLLERLPYRTQTVERRLESDVTNLIFAGEAAAIDRAFRAAGWQVPEALNSATRYRTLRAMAENQEYKEAPMSLLLLDDQPPVQAWAKALNTFSKRHHLRVYATEERWLDRPVFTAAATQDISINFSRGRDLFTHLIDEHIDRERSKVVNDLLFTGCVESVGQVPRPWLPEQPFNSTGQTLVTDREAAVLVFNDCLRGQRFDEPMAAAPGPYRGNRVSRIVRQTVLTFRNDIYRGSLWYQGASILTQGFRHYRQAKRSIRPVPGPTITGTPAKAPKVLSDPADWAPPTVELSVRAGLMVFSHSSIGAEGLRISHPHHPDNTLTLRAANRVAPAFALGGAVTINQFRWFSHELGFGYQRGDFTMDLAGVPGISEQRSGFLTRQFSYNALVHLRPRESRWRPYFAAGPVLQLVHLTDAPFTKARGIFRFGLNNVGMFRAAYDFGSVPPLEGGGIFQTGLQVGGGVRYRVSPHWTVRFDYRNTCSPRPDLLRKSLEPQIMPERLERGKISQQRLSLGFAFTF
jgi:opacity protein-like surface antigen